MAFRCLSSLLPFAVLILFALTLPFRSLVCFHCLSVCFNCLGEGNLLFLQLDMLVEMIWVFLQIVNETIPALLKLKEVGKIRFIGITGLPLGIFTYVLDRVPPGSVDVILSYCHYSINDNALEDLLPHLKSKGVGVISASPLAMGLLTENGPPEWHPASPELKVIVLH